MSCKTILKITLLRILDDLARLHLTNQEFSYHIFLYLITYSIETCLIFAAHFKEDIDRTLLNTKHKVNYEKVKIFHD